MFVHAKDEDILRQKRFKLSQPRLAHVTESCVMCPTLGIVPMGYDDKINPEVPKNVCPLHPVEVLAYLIDLIDRKRVPPHRQCGGTGCHQTTALFDPFCGFNQFFNADVISGTRHVLCRGALKIERTDPVRARLQQVGQFIQLGCICACALKPQLFVDNHTPAPRIGRGIPDTAGHCQALGQGKRPSL